MQKSFQLSIYADIIQVFPSGFRYMNHVRDESLLCNFGVHLAKIRKLKGLSQGKLAFNAGVSLSQISRIERGIVNPTLSTLSVLSKALDLTIAGLVEGI